ncbi:hypothetical protein AOQ88_02495, partial [Candidatus Riesia sp. GBBU]
SLRKLREVFSFPIIGIIPDIKSAVKITKNKIVGLLATKATINSAYMKRFIKNFSSYVIIRNIIVSDIINVVENMFNTTYQSVYKTLSILSPWIEDRTSNPDTIILGCTHLLLIKKEIKNFFGRKINLIDSKSDLLKNVYIYKKSIFSIKKKNTVYYTKMEERIKILIQVFKEIGFEKFEEIFT